MRRTAPAGLAGALLIGACGWLCAATSRADDFSGRTELQSVPTAPTTVRTNLPFRAPRSATPSSDPFVARGSAAKASAATDSTSAPAATDSRSTSAKPARADAQFQAAAWEEEETAYRRPSAARGRAVGYEVSGEAYAGEEAPGRGPRVVSSQREPAWATEPEAVEAWESSAAESREREPFSQYDPALEAGTDEEFCSECGELEGPGHAHGQHGHWLKSFLPADGVWFRTSKNSPPSIGLGEPLKGTSWLNRPNSVSFFAGILNGQELITNRVDQGSALFGGLRLGWDFDHYWGMEARAGWASPELEYEPASFETRVNGIFLCDASFLYYPWGDAAWRPYGLLGMGMSRADFVDDLGQIHDEYLLGIPIGFGMKYMYHPNLAFRAEFLDNIAMGSSGVNGQGNLSFTLGMELRYGGKPRTYYPWQAAKYIW